ncbi:MAG: DNA translocase FtsK 4TM domain-containing protein, partial [Campylobacteraceae bacterium]|nr:DNA translocase FtsK 4TM domain-containing protein [Campylobacteraceae bacterium]
MILFGAFLVFLGIATIVTDTSLVGAYGKTIGIWNRNIFGFFAYAYPFLLIVPLYLFYKYPQMDMRKIEVFLALVLFFLAILMFQAAIIANEGMRGHLGFSIIDILSAFIGTFGVWVFIVAITMLSVSVIFNFEFESLVYFVKSVISKISNIYTAKLEEKKELEESVFFSDNTVSKLDNPTFFRKPAKKIDLRQKEQSNGDFSVTPVAIIEERNNDEYKKEYHTKVEILSEIAENKRLLSQIEQGAMEKPKDYRLPPFNFLVDPPKKVTHVNENEIDRKISDLLDKLRRFKIDGDVVRTYAGPVVTTFEFKPAPHVKVSKILTLQDDLAMALMAQTIRIQAPVPGKDVIGIEIPNKHIETIYLKEILESEIFKKSFSPLTIALGKDIVGSPFVTDLKKLPHLLIAGTTGSGKSVGINAMLLSLLYRNSPDTLRLLMIDPKMLEFS